MPWLIGASPSTFASVAAVTLAGEGQCHAVKDSRHGGDSQPSWGNCGTDQRPAHSSDKIAGCLMSTLHVTNVVHVASTSQTVLGLPHMCCGPVGCIISVVHY